ncbi:MAG TPA: MFS transporter [Ktedonobacterales bacterium]
MGVVARKDQRRLGGRFAVLWWARTISFSGDVLAQVALVVLAARQPNAAMAVSLLLLAQTVPWLLGPLAGIVADRTGLRRLMLACELGQGLLVAAIALTGPSFAVTLALVAGMTLLATIFSPAGKSALPALVPAEQLGNANALLRLGANVSRVAGPAIAGLLLAAAFGLPLVLLLDALSFALSTLLLSRLPPLAPTPDARGPKPAGIAISLRDGLRYLLRHPIARAVTLALFLVTIFVALDNVGLVFLAERTLAGGPAGFGLALTGYGLGMVVAPLVLLRLKARMSPAPILLAGIAIMGLGTALCGLAPSLGAAVALQGVVGIGNGFENVATDTLLQAGIARELLGRIFGVAYAVPYAALLITYPAGGALLALTSARVVFVVAGVGTLAAGIVTAAMLPRRPAPAERRGEAGLATTGRGGERMAEGAGTQNAEVAEGHGGRREGS